MFSQFRHFHVQMHYFANMCMGKKIGPLDGYRLDTPDFHFVFCLLWETACHNMESGIGNGLAECLEETSNVERGSLRSARTGVQEKVCHASCSTAVIPGNFMVCNDTDHVDICLNGMIA